VKSIDYDPIDSPLIPGVNAVNKEPFSNTPRASVVKAIFGAALILVAVSLPTMGYKQLGIFGIIPIVIGGMLMRDYFREIGFK